MSFTSSVFAVFLAVLLIGYYLLPQRAQWVWLLLGSYVFYCWSAPSFAAFLLFSTVTTWLFPLWMGQISRQQKEFLASPAGKALSREEKKAYKARRAGSRRLLLVLCLVCNIGLLVFLKYTNFLISILNGLGAELLPLEWLVLPLGFSFYTFQSVGYCLDVYWDNVEPQPNFFRYALYVSFFPQVSQGPIGRYGDMAPQLYAGHTLDYDRLLGGFFRLMVGLWKKLVLANRLALYVDGIYGAPADYSGGILALATLMYGLELYADFSGYTDIALGVGEMLGIRLPENFDTPYFSHSITEFWRRWHTTLGDWFRDYLYYPIQRSALFTGLHKSLTRRGQKALAKTLVPVLGLAITWLLIGMWHGASWNFILYGLYHGSFIMLAVILGGWYGKAKAALHIREENRLWRAFQVLRTFAIVTLGYVLFRAPDLATAGLIFGKIFTGIWPRRGVGYLNGLTLSDFTAQTWLVCLVMLAVALAVEIYQTRHSLWAWFAARRPAVQWLVLYAMALCILVFGEFGVTSFLYFQF